MRFKTDENIPVDLAEMLRQHGHDALTVPEQAMAGKVDDEIAAVCRQEDRALVTLDLDFADIRHYPPQDHKGIIVLRPAVQNIASLVRLAGRILQMLGVEPLDGRLWIVDDNRVRIRGEQTPAP